MEKINLLALFLLVTILGGCAKNSEPVGACGKSVSSDVFCEVSDAGPVQQGYADLSVVSSLKTHKPDYHQMVDTHGTSTYKLLINIDGQVTVISGRLNKENIESRKLRDPEAGDGIRYVFRKKLRLKAGTHRIVVAIPEDEIAEKREITLADGSVNSLEMEPVYGTKRSGGRMTSRGDRDFYEGIDGFRVLLNGKSP